MIVRIAGEGQWELADGAVERLNEIDNALDPSAGEEARLREALRSLLDLVRTQGDRVPDDRLVESDVILPSPDVDAAELREAFAGEGLIPG